MLGDPPSTANAGAQAAANAFVASNLFKGQSNAFLQGALALAKGRDGVAWTPRLASDPARGWGAWTS